MTTHVLAIGFGPMEIAIVGGIALLLFGKRLPGAMNSLGRSFVEFKKGVKGIDEEPRDDERKDEKAASSPS